MSCGKYPYPTKHAAKNSAGRLMACYRKGTKSRQAGKAGRPLRVYRCDICRYWHLTSAPLRIF